MVHQDTNNSGKEQIIQTLIQLITDICKHSNHVPSSTPSSHPLGKLSQRNAEQVTQIRSLLPELINTYLVVSGCRKDIDGIIEFIKFIIQRIPNAHWIGDAGAICFYLFKLIPFLTSVKHMQDNDLRENFVVTVRLIIGLLLSDVGVLSLFLKETLYIYEDLLELLEMEATACSSVLPVLLKTYCELSASFANTKSMSVLDPMPVDNNNNNNNTSTDNGAGQQHPIDGVIVSITSLDMVVSLISGLLVASAPYIESTSQFLGETVAPYWTAIVRLIKCAYSPRLTSSALNTLGIMLRCYPLPSYLHNDILKVLLTSAATISTSPTPNQNLQADRAGDALSSLLKHLGDQTIFLSTETTVQVVPLVLGHSQSATLKRTICALYLQTLSLSPPIHTSIIALVPFLADIDARNNLIACFKAVFAKSLELENRAPKTTSRFSTVLLNRLLAYVAVYPPNADLGGDGVDKIQHFINAFSGIMSACRDHHESLKDLLDLFTQQISELYKSIIVLKQVSTRVLAIIRESLALSLDILIEVVHPILDKSSNASQVKFTLDCIFNLSFLPWNHASIFTTGTYPAGAFEAIRIQCLQLQAWTPSLYFCDERKAIFNEMLMSASQLTTNAQDQQSSTSQTPCVEIEFLSLIPIFLLNLGEVGDRMLTDTMASLNLMTIKANMRETALQVLAYVGGMFVCIAGGFCKMTQVPENRGAKDIIVNGSILLIESVFKIDSLVPTPTFINILTNSRRWKPKCTCHSPTTKDSLAPTASMRDAPFVHLLTCQSDVVRHLYLRHTIKRLVPHMVPNESNIAAFYDAIIPMLIDPSELVRTAAIKCILELVKRDLSPSRDSSLSPLFLRIKPVISTRGETEPVVVSVLSLISLVANIVDIDSPYFRVATGIVIESLGKTVSIRLAAKDALELMARTKGHTVRTLIPDMAPNLYPRIIEYLRDNPQALEELAIILKTTLDDFLTTSLPFVLPSLYFHRSTSVLSELGMHVDLKDATTTHFEMIFEYILMNTADFNIISSATTFIAARLDHDTTQLIGKIPTDITKRLILRLGDADPVQAAAAVPALQAAFLLINHRDSSKLPFDKCLVKEFLGVMNSFTVIMSKSRLVSERQTMMRAFHRLIEHIGSSVNFFRPKIMVFLKLAVGTVLEDLALDIWKTFVQLIAPDSLGPILNQLLFALLPFVANHPDKVYPIYEYLVIKRKESTQAYFNTVPFLPREYTILVPIADEIARTQARVSIRNQVYQLLTLLATENNDVKLMTLSRLRTILHENRTHIVAPSADNNDGKNILADLTRSLLICCRDPFLPIQVAVTKCLGELGAIDPEGFSISLRSNAFEEKQRQEIAHDLIVHYLTKFVCSPSNPTPQDRAGYAIQEILKICGCVDIMQTAEGFNLLSGFSPEVKEILHPYRTSDYVLPPPLNKPVPLRNQPFFNRGVLYRKWMMAWVADLVYRTSGPTEPIFLACRGIIRDDIRICHYLLPYLIINIFETGTSEDKSSVTMEVQEVLKNDTDMSSENGQMCTQRILEIIDALNRWVETRKKRLANPDPKKASPKNKKADIVLVVESFLGEIPEILLSTASARCGALANSLIHLESHIRKEVEAGQNRQIVINNNLPLLQKIYHDIDDVDGLLGLASLRTNTTMDDKILEYESSGSWNDSFLYHTNASQATTNNTSHKLGQLRAMFNLGHYEAVLTMADGFLHDTRSKGTEQFNTYCVQAAWRLGNWERVSLALSTPSLEDTFEVSIARTLLALYKHNERDFTSHLYQARVDLTQHLSAASLDSHQRCYPYITQLHILNDIESSWTLVNASSGEPAQLLDLLTARFRLVRPSIRIREPILTVRRVILDIFRLKEEKSMCWLQLAKYSRQELKFEMATNALLAPSMTENSRPYLFEKAKLAIARGQASEGIQILRTLIQTHPVNMPKNIISYAKIQLLLAKIKQDSGTTQFTDIIHSAKEATAYQWEKGLLFLARLYDSLLPSIKNNTIIIEKETLPDIQTYTKYISRVLKSYGRSLIQGYKYISHSMPRMLTLWTELGSMLVDKKIEVTKIKQWQNRQHDKKEKQLESKLKLLKTTMIGYATKISAYQWLTCFSQLCSRLSHNHADTWEVLEKIIVRVLIEHPHQGMWHIVAMLGKSTPQRAERANRCVNEALRQSPSVQRGTRCPIKDTTLVAEQLLILGQTDIKKGPVTAKLSDIGKRLLEMRNVNVIIPIQSSFVPNLPASGLREPKPTVFNLPLPTIASFEDHVDVMTSLQRPKKIIVNGSNGHAYPFLVKAKDDLRKDNRLLELMALLNKVLRKDPACRKRRLGVRGYSVTPVGDDCGIIEWVPNLVALRGTLLELYKDVPVYVKHNKGYSKMMEASTNKLETFLKQVLPNTPPVFHNWFLRSFPDPLAWLEARTSFTSTSAVMAMIGSVIGLGDRHGDNILLNTTNGESIHVDLNCVFWKGETFHVPERVPFRMTQNIIDAFGVSGCEGAFRTNCEHTLRVIRSNRDAFVNVLETLIYDPFIEWRDQSLSKPLEFINLATRKIQGNPEGVGLTLSIEGQVNQLIQEATDPKRLSEMYVGWAAWL
eukprot:gene4009-4642_t